ncbi:MAG: hypothetical protein UX80_C0002G0073 [Candidatus Amesbacteria bacterium GW2011_GWA2_47_11b]|uniref:Uncharacterized protein n=3 Tax=Candidatus Amesiibacteriota TaxID=1752730 RepID=A0A0G1SI46_9BACT|nr:MAG: hypothetical protein UX42_C0015G0006 [Microgenomates group bacterium GW2011_GWC1_46_20]KKU58538.1 MAG: hypothetical protein UX80_C0002G0073 [Candidatus Amesbacteria bacterium GW2011_GWA2_47_11b]KKU69099.1 MAG: hypothetical protein UX92_C0015G0006 [Candidatus Amesbacteria bacterium GW2011_GWA1_47_20]KKU83666.1 MAG: hypothetical protein UY11_C0015G0029 [Candidatus Amesbacteria bacterium GW2011_GWC2_47_8]
MKIIIVILLSLYLLLPAPKFPDSPPGSLQSNEPADTETIYRQAYYTNLTRPEIMDYYDQAFRGPIQYRLNLPPEDSFTVIRDQTKSSFLEQIVHPLRETLYINAFVPTKPTEQINIDGVHYFNKVTIHYLPSHPVSRLTVLALSSLLFLWLIKEYSHV